MQNESKNSELTTEQNKILETIYGYKSHATYSDEEIRIAKEMFDTPEKFALLRKILGILTLEEKGLLIPNVARLNEMSFTDKENYAVHHAVYNLADEKIRQALTGFYILLKEQIKKDKKDEFEKLNKEEFEKQQEKEKATEEFEIAERKVGENL